LVFGSLEALLNSHKTDCFSETDLKIKSMLLLLTKATVLQNGKSV